ncbi:CAP domain-containing protein [Natronorubrum sp. JWXQ-INN-674]|uniref:CAP domain-containing protein n=1 Tax=Natronorubrum halalkaliphilum TaxID=2691917 RepID=A0A6B0VQA0_9EURY|nr:CAP domain-containing protein [Natronorubrum halalkaliphilum]MXV63810.1 CAP domain-containing protein [Natronorubrum halalkaliphilum]
MCPRSRSNAAADGSDGSNGPGDDAVVRSLLRFTVVVVLVGALALGTAVLAPTVLEDLSGLSDDDFQVPEEVDIREQPSPSSDPPPAGERNPNVTDPNDPGESTYETDIETVESAAVEDFIHAEVNDRRADHGLEPLEWDGTIASVSRAHSHDMADRDYFDHVNPDGQEPMDRFTDVDGYCRGYGENIAMTWVDHHVERPGTGETVRYQTSEDLAVGLVDQWMNSTSHRQAILEEGSTPDWDRGGVGVYIAAEGEVYASHNFCLEW